MKKIILFIFYVMYANALAIIYKITHSYYAASTEFFFWSSNKEKIFICIVLILTLIRVGYDLFREKKIYTLPLLLMFTVLGDVSDVVTFDQFLYVLFIVILLYDIKEKLKSKGDA